MDQLVVSFLEGCALWLLERCEVDHEADSSFDFYAGEQEAGLLLFATGEWVLEDPDDFGPTQPEYHTWG